MGGRTLVQSLIRYALQDVPASVVIPGCKTPDQVCENLGASAAPELSAREVARVHEIHGELVTQFGQIHPYAMDVALGLE